MKVISSKNTWYLIFGIIFIIVITATAFRLIFKRTEEKLSGTTPTKQTQTTKRSTLVGQTSTKSNLTYTSPSPVASPSPRSSSKPLFTLFNTASPSPKPLALGGIKSSPSPSPTPSLVEATPVATASGVITTKGGLTLVVDQNGATYLSTKKADGSTDSAKLQKVTGLTTLIQPPKGFAVDLGAYINQLLKVILMIAALLVFTQLIWGGLEWITSGGDKKKVDDARGKITAAVIGLVIVASSFAVLQLALNFIGYSSINELLKML